MGRVSFSCQNKIPNKIPKIINVAYTMIENIDCGAPKLYAFMIDTFPKLRSVPMPTAIRKVLELIASDLFCENIRCRISITIEPMMKPYAFIKNKGAFFGMNLVIL